MQLGPQPLNDRLLPFTVAVDAHKANIGAIVMQGHSLLATAAIFKALTVIVKNKMEMIVSGYEAFQHKVAFASGIELCNIHTLSIDIYFPGNAKYHLAQILALHPRWDMHP